jgi:hypothetical protein
MEMTASTRTLTTKCHASRRGLSSHSTEECARGDISSFSLAPPFTEEGNAMTTFELLVHALVAALLVELLLVVLKGRVKNKKGQ